MPLGFLTALPRRLAVLARHRRSAQEGFDIAAKFEAWRASLDALPAPSRRTDELLLIRLDDIGDYLLFRNQLTAYRHSERGRQHRITLLGNSAWKALFEAFDADSVDQVLWVDKGRYLTDEPYRGEIWSMLRSRGVDTVIAPSRTRPLLLDDLCMLAAAPRHCQGAVNTYVHENWNRLSDALYTQLFAAPDTRVHEFEFNGEFAAWACGERYAGSRPALELAVEPAPGDYLLCFLGANTRSKRWPAKRWIELIERYRGETQRRVVLAGHSRAEQHTAAEIQAAVTADSIVGHVSLLELVAWVRSARAVVSNDTMAAHLGVALDRPTVIVANGVNYQRFTEYSAAHIRGVVTAYPEVFSAMRSRRGDFEHHYADAITADIASIRGGVVLAALEHVLQDR